jgi:hypothetical protein
MPVALAVTRINPIIVLLSAISMAIVSFVFVISEYTKGYRAAALSVCKNE